MVLSPKNLASWMAMLEFGRHAPANGAADGNGAAKKDAPFDSRIKGLGIDELLDQLIGPVVGGIELEAKRRVDLEALSHRLDGRGVVGAGSGEPHRDDEGDRLRLAPHHLSHRCTRMNQSSLRTYHSRRTHSAALRPR